MSRDVVTLPDGRLALPLEPAEVQNLGITGKDKLKVFSGRGFVEATRVNPWEELQAALNKLEKKV